MSHTRRQLFVLQKSLDGLQEFFIAKWIIDQQAADPVIDDLFTTTVSAAHAWLPTIHRFQIDQAESFLAAWHDEGMTPRIKSPKDF